MICKICSASILKKWILCNFIFLFLNLFSISYYIFCYSILYRFFVFYEWFCIFNDLFLFILFQFANEFIYIFFVSLNWMIVRNNNLWYISSEIWSLNSAIIIIPLLDFFSFALAVLFCQFSEKMRLLHFTKMWWVFLFFKIVFDFQFPIETTHFSCLVLFNIFCWIHRFTQIS